MTQKYLFAILLLAISCMLATAQNQGNYCHYNFIFCVILTPSNNFTSNVTDNTSIKEIQVKIYFSNLLIDFIAFIFKYWSNWTLSNKSYK